MKTLLIKLAGSVSDSTLPKFGELTLQALMNMGNAANYPQRVINIAVKEPITVTADGTGFFTNEDYSGNLGKSITVSPGDMRKVTLGISSSQYNVKFSNKYAITHLQFWCGYMRNIKLSDFRDMVGLLDFRLYSGGSNLSGTLADISTLVNMVSLVIDSAPNVTGAISSLLPMTKMVYLRLWNSTNASWTMPGITGATSDIASLYPTLNSVNLQSTSVTGSWPPA